jgi:diaminopropionate ammonia-lyase
MFENPYRNHGLDCAELTDMPYPSTDVEAVLRLLKRCPHYARTPLVQDSNVGDAGTLWIKDESNRMGLGSFKALGAAYVIAHLAQHGDVSGQTLVTASAGNHGLSVAAGAAAFGAKAVIYLSETVPEDFAARLRAIGADVVRAGADYEASMAAALEASKDNGWTLLSDSSWKGYSELPHRLMEGYLVLAQEIIEDMPEPPTHIFLQAGVGGLAGSAAALFRKAWGDEPKIIVVEPAAAPAIIESLRAGRPVAAGEGVSSMGRLDCKEPSYIALKGLARDADVCLTFEDAFVEARLEAAAEHGIMTSPSGGAGVAAYLSGAVEGIDASSRVLCILSEGPVT